MADSHSPSLEPTPGSLLPQKRTLEDEHVPAVSSPLNPESGTSKARASKDKAPMHREPREKKESLKKREAKSTSVPAEARGTPDRRSPSGWKQNGSKESSTPASIAPLRYKLPSPIPSDYHAPRAPVYSSHHIKKTSDGQETQFYETSEHVSNRKGFRYTHCVADPAFPSSFYYRQSESEPFQPRINYEDTSSHILLDQTGNHITTTKGFRMARANIGVREGRWYWECRITSGVPRESQDAKQEGHQSGVPESGGHVRFGWARREASLDAPVGFDAYSYGLRDVGGQKVHMSRPKDFFPSGEDIRESDVIGLEINLPSLALHRKIVEGQYNPAVDINDAAAAEDAEASDIIRDRVPIRYKAHLYFEQFEYHSTKELEELMNPSPSVTTAAASGTGGSASQDPNPIHPLVPLRTLPNSSIRIYKNGQPIGDAFTDLLAFLPPASRPQSQVGARDGLDDGMLGYFPAVSVFRGGAAEVNFGPDFWYPPPTSVSAWPTGGDGTGDVQMTGTGEDDGANQQPLAEGRLRPVGERYNEQIAEDVTYDLVDEVDFWLQDGGSTIRKSGISDAVPTVLGPVDPGAMEVEEAMPNMLAVASREGGIKEIVQEDE
ncbi:MAG: hypothetical protein M1837_001000 [Sclerophora amabilis]|nr:MAG: hypothetical protein M1837_001000 [Sclerophora amabilis]